LETELFYLYDDTEETKTRFVSFSGDEGRYDLAITMTDRFYGKKLVINLQNNRAAIVGEDDLKEEGYLEFAFGLSKKEVEDLNLFLQTII